MWRGDCCSGKAWAGVSQAIRFGVLEMSENDCQTILGSTGLLERVVTRSGFTASMKSMAVHCSRRSFVLMIAANRVVREVKEAV